MVPLPECDDECIPRESGAVVVYQIRGMGGDYLLGCERIQEDRQQARAAAMVNKESR